jgi:hypothetical protein
VTTESEQNLIRLCHYEAFRTGLEWAVTTLPADHRAIYLEQALAAAMSVLRQHCPDEITAVCRRTGLDLMPSPPQKPKPRRIVDWFRRQDAGSLVALASYAVLIGWGVFAVVKSIW